ncbi:hypothetical protein HPB51_012370 [Rhipicephalus microplus]|uniref:Uncharacterized protein n=1 Tax=Rhipicephalus microplus TaxID=6941 RepID=A0A9J6DGR2_RHIMP|nr:hypothetical protein HPB51_012370 [Rhipicephalus microplus]
MPTGLCSTADPGYANDSDIAYCDHTAKVHGVQGCTDTEGIPQQGAFRREFASADVTKRLKDELEACTQHFVENLKEFIYVITEFYDRIGEEVADDIKVDRVLRQMHIQLQDLVAGSTFSCLKALADVADGLMK